MAPSPNLTLSGLVHRCRRETDRFFRGKAYDPVYCFELFRLALADQNQDAWEIVFDLYTPLVLSWVRKHGAFPDCGEEDRFFLNRAFERLWTNLTLEKFDKQASLGGVLDYLKLCVHSAIIDYVRKQDPLTVNPEVIAPPVDPQPGPDLITDHQDFWELVKTKMKDDKERCFLISYFSLGYKPREIAADFPDIFKDVREVYRTRDNIINRLGRDPDLKGIVE